MRRWNGVLFGLSLIAVLALMIPSFDSSAALAQNAPQAAGAPNAAPSEPPPANKAEWQQLHAQIKALRANAWEQIRATLTDEQKATLDASELGQWQMGGHPKSRGCGGMAGVMNAKGDESGHPLLARLTQKLGLSADQQTSIQTILDNAQTARKARHEQARTDFRAILTPEQVAKMDTMKGPAGAMRPGCFGRGQRHVAGATASGPLQLTPEQKTQAHAIFSQVRTDMEKLRADTHAQISALLTDAQKTQFDAMSPAKGGAWASAIHGRHAGWGQGGGEATLLDRMTTRLNLTDAQRTSIQSILDNLHTSVQTLVQQAHANSAENATKEQGAAPDIVGQPVVAP